MFVIRNVVHTCFVVGYLIFAVRPGKSEASTDRKDWAKCLEGSGVGQQM